MLMTKTIEPNSQLNIKGGERTSCVGMKDAKKLLIRVSVKKLRVNVKEARICFATCRDRQRPSMDAMGNVRENTNKKDQKKKSQKRIQTKKTNKMKTVRKYVSSVSESLHWS
jgi:hypothetical protein